MATFIYTARNKSGVIQKGNLFAATRAAAAANLNEKGLVPILLKEDSGARSGGKLSLGKFKLGKKVGLKDKVVFSRQFATMINAGVPINQSLNILKEQSESAHLKEVITDAAKKIEGGSTLANALGDHPDVFNNVYINMVRAGETGGLLDQVLERLATQQEKDAEIVGKVKSAMIYPGVIFTVTIIAFVFLMTVIVPKLAVIFEGFGGKLPIYTRIMLGMSHALTHFGLFIGAGVVAGIVALNRYIKTPVGRKMFDTTMLKMPIFGPIVAKLNVARFARTFGSLMSSGISVLDALNATSTALSNTVFQDALKQVAKEVKNGKPISEPMRSMKIFPPIVAQMIAVGEETGQIDTILIKLADFYEREIDTVVSGITSIIEPILIIFLGAMVGFIVISVFGPISQLSNNV